MQSLLKLRGILAELTADPELVITCPLHTCQMSEEHHCCPQNQVLNLLLLPETG